jgi:hypothetical protein
VVQAKASSNFPQPIATLRNEAARPRASVQLLQLRVPHTVVSASGSRIDQVGARDRHGVIPSVPTVFGLALKLFHAMR